MKKFLIMFLLIILCSLATSNALAYSEEFSLMISTMGIPEQNKNGKSLNESIYENYSLFVYGSPLDGYKEQRWKDVPEGRSIKNGVRGEYWILGENQEGIEVHNHKFPADIEPPTTPENWRYAEISGAEESWLDQSKYMDDVQKEYMLTSKLMRNDVTYNITVQDIGLDKVKLENYATWTTKGSVYTNRYDMQNKKWAANFMVQPMAGDATLDGHAEFPDGTKFKAENDTSSVNVPITYEAEVLNLTNYARKEHVKEIKSELYINDVLIDSAKDTESLSVNGACSYTVNKENDNETIVLYITLKSTLVTKFTTDGALVDIKKYVVTVTFGEALEEDPLVEPETHYNNVRTEQVSTSEEIPPPHISKVTIQRVVNGRMINLPVSKKTSKEFVCAGQTIFIKATIENLVDHATVSFQGDSSIFTFDDLTKKFEWDEPKSRGEKTFYNSIDGFKRMYNKTILLTNERGSNNYTYTYIIPYGTKQTLNSWSTLREKASDAFSIDENQLFTRISKPYEIVIKAEGEGGKDTKRIELDVFERWDTLYNRDISKYIK